MSSQKFTMVVVMLLGNTRCVLAADWITAPSYYTHNPQTGERVSQFAPIPPVYAPVSENFVRSGYRHTRSTIEAGGSVDHLHLVEEWGRPVRPYDEWRFPYRPYSVPYSMWGPQQFGWGGFGGGFGVVAPGAPGVGFNQGNPLNPAIVPPGAGASNNALPWMDGHYPTYDRHDRAPYYFPYQGPYNSANGFGGADGTTGVGP